jgi:glycine/sarcosine/betaine reductase complex component C subunit beta
MGSAGVRGRDVSIVGASLTLQHVPDLVRYGSKPRREQERLPQILGALRSFSDAVDYPPNQVFIGNTDPDILRQLARPWWRSAPPGDPRGAFGDIIDQLAFYELLAELDQFELVRLKEEPRPGELPFYDGDEIVGAFAPAHESDESLTAHVLLENLACKAGAVHATRRLLASTGVDPASIPYVIGAGEEAVGDRYQRGGGNLGKAIAEAAGITEASGCDIKAFCAAPIHALVVAGALVSSGVYDRVAVVAGGALGKLGMKFEGALEHDMPILEDVLASMAILVGTADDGGPRIRMDAVGRHRVAAGASQQALLEDIVGTPLAAMGRTIADVDVYATELHNPEITESSGGGDVPDRNYRMLAGLGVVRGDLTKDELLPFVRAHGLPGFSPTQGHIASAIPWLPHALRAFQRGELHTTMLMAKGSLFLGRMTRLWDGASITLEG